jgi:hypothetical protein
MEVTWRITTSPTWAIIHSAPQTPSLLSGKHKPQRSPHECLRSKPHRISCFFSVWSWSRHQNREIRVICMKSWGEARKSHWLKGAPGAVDNLDNNLFRSYGTPVWCDLNSRGSVWLGKVNLMKIRWSWKVRGLAVTWILDTGDSGDIGNEQNTQPSADYCLNSVNNGLDPMVLCSWDHLHILWQETCELWEVPCGRQLPGTHMMQGCPAVEPVWPGIICMQDLRLGRVWVTSFQCPWRYGQNPLNWFCYIDG